MNAIMALLTAASVLAHAALGCCVHHAHTTAADSVASRLATPHDGQHEQAHHRHGLFYSHDHSPIGEPTQPPQRHCGEGICAAIVSATAHAMAKQAQSKCGTMPLAELRLVVLRMSLYAEYLGLQHDLGPPLRPHLFHRVLLI